MGVEKISQPDAERKKALLEELIKAGDGYMNPAVELAKTSEAAARQHIYDLREQCLNLGITQAEIKAAIKERQKNKV